MSLVLFPEIPLFHAPQLTLLSSVAVCRVLRKLYEVNAGIKWPNDVLIDGKKVCGILLESSAENERLKHIIAGIGISANLRAEDYDEELRVKATSILLETGRKVDREELIAAFLQEFESLYELYLEQGFAPIRILWEALSVSLDCQVRVKTAEGWVEGRATSIDDQGVLHIMTNDDRSLKFFAGELEYANA